MICFDLECSRGHRFEGIFKDYNSFNKQLNNAMINCPICNSKEVKRLFTGCSIQAKSRDIKLKNENDNENIFEMIKEVKRYIKNNFDYVGREFAEVSRAIYYGIEEERNIYGESTNEEIKEMKEEGIEIFPLPDIEKLEN